MNRLGAPASFVVACMLAACSSSTGASTPMPTIATAPPHYFAEVSGYPLDRTLAGLAEYPELDGLLVVNKLEIGLPHAAPNGMIETPVRGIVVESLRGTFVVGAPFTFSLLGGTIGNQTVLVDKTVGADPGEVSESGMILIGGQSIKDSLQPTFVYAVDPNGSTLRSLLTSGSPQEPALTLEQVREAIAGTAQ